MTIAPTSLAKITGGRFAWDHVALDLYIELCRQLSSDDRFCDDMDQLITEAPPAALEVRYSPYTGKSMDEPPYLDMLMEGPQAGDALRFIETRNMRIWASVEACVGADRPWLDLARRVAKDWQLDGTRWGPGMIVDELLDRRSRLARQQGETDALFMPAYEMLRAFGHNSRHAFREAGIEIPEPPLFEPT